MPIRPSASVSNVLLGSTLTAASAFCLASIAVEGLAPGSLPVLALPGSFLIGAFAWASPFVAVWLAAAAILAFLPGWRPASLAALAGSVLPFLPIAAIARLGAEPEPFLSKHPYLAAAGLPALVLAGLAISLALAAFVAYASRAVAALSIVRRPPRPTRGLLPPPPAPILPLVPNETKDAPFEFRVPELPPLPLLRALEEGPVDGSSETPDAVDAADAPANVETSATMRHGEESSSSSRASGPSNSCPCPLPTHTAPPPTRRPRRRPQPPET